MNYGKLLQKVFHILLQTLQLLFLQMSHLTNRLYNIFSHNILLYYYIILFVNIHYNLHQLNLLVKIQFVHLHLSMIFQLILHIFLNLYFLLSHLYHRLSIEQVQYHHFLYCIQLLQLLGHFDLLAEVHAAARGLLAVPQGGVKNLDALHGCFPPILFQQSFFTMGAYKRQ